MQTDRHWKADLRRDHEAAEFPIPPGAENYAEFVRRIELQRAFFRLAVDQKPDLSITLKLNTVCNVRNKLKQFGAILDRYFLGRNWCKRPSADRFFFVAFIEPDRDATGAQHAHLLVRLPTSTRERWRKRPWKATLLSERLTSLIRRKGMPAGNVHIRLIKSEWEAESAASYAVKNAKRQEWNSANFILSTEFSSRLSAGP